MSPSPLRVTEHVGTVFKFSGPSSSSVFGGMETYAVTVGSPSVRYSSLERGVTVAAFTASVVPYARVVAVVGAVIGAVVGAVRIRDYIDGYVCRQMRAIGRVPLVYFGHFGHGTLTAKPFFENHLTWEGDRYQATKIGA